MAWARNHEEVAAPAFESIKHLKKDRCGFCIDPACSWLGASPPPPGRIVNGSSNPGLVEIKCPLSAMDCSLEEFAKKRSSYLHIINGEVLLKRSHTYCQVLGQKARNRNKTKTKKVM